MAKIDEVNKIINESGNSFHCKVTNYLKEKGWCTMVSPYYMDGSTNKPREIDLIIEKAWEYTDRWNDKYGTINIKLFIECKYIPQPNVFWFSHKDMISTRKWLINNTPLPENNTFTEQHHYLTSDNKVAKLFASKNKPHVENEVIYKALNQSLNAMVYLRRQESILPVEPRRNNNILATIELPLILCNSFEKFYRVEMEDATNPEQIQDNFQLEVNYAYLDHNKNNRNEFFLIDIVSFECIDNFLSQLEKDIEAIHQVI